MKNMLISSNNNTNQSECSRVHADGSNGWQYALAILSTGHFSIFLYRSFPSWVSNCQLFSNVAPVCICFLWRSARPTRMVMLAGPTPTATKSIPVRPAVISLHGLIQHCPLPCRDFPCPPHHLPLFLPLLQHSWPQFLQQLRTSQMLHVLLNLPAPSLVATPCSSTQHVLIECAAGIVWKLEVVKEWKATFPLPCLLQHQTRESNEQQCRLSHCNHCPPHCHCHLPPPPVHQLQWTCLQTHDMHHRWQPHSHNSMLITRLRRNNSEQWMRSALQMLRRQRTMSLYMRGQRYVVSP